MQFSALYGTELDRELGTSLTALFTVARRKAAVNAAQLEFLERTECLQRQVAVPLSDETQEYDLEASITDFGWIAKQGVSIKIVDSDDNERYIEGNSLQMTTVERLNIEEPGWRAVSPSAPRKIYLRRDGGSVYLGFHPAPDISDGDTWTALVMAVVIPADMSADADEPFTVSASAVKSLRPFHRALVHFAAYDLEKFRKDMTRAAAQMALFDGYVERYIGRQRPKQGQQVRFARLYRGRAGRSITTRGSLVISPFDGGAFD